MANALISGIHRSFYVSKIKGNVWKCCNFESLTHQTLSPASAARCGTAFMPSHQRAHIQIDSHRDCWCHTRNILTKNQNVLGLFPRSSRRSLTSPCLRTLLWYLNKTKASRKYTKLFILSRAPYMGSSKLLLDNLIQPHTLPEENRAYDIRGKALSRALFTGVNIEEVFSATSWKTPSTFVASYELLAHLHHKQLLGAELGIHLGKSHSGLSSQ